MEEQLISFETAKLAKEKGFKEPVISGYSEQGSLFVKDYEKSHCYNVRGLFSAPSQSLLQKWLRDRFTTYVLVLHDGKTFYYQIQRPEWDDCITNFELNKQFTYEQALEYGLQEALKLI